MTEREKEIVRRLMHPVYTVDYLEEWLERKDNVFVNPVAALSAMGGTRVLFCHPSDGRTVGWNERLT